MSQPNAVTHRGRDPREIRQELDAAGWTLAEAAMLAGVTPRLLTSYLGPGASTARPLPYPLQFTLEAIVRMPKPPRKAKAQHARKTAPPEASQQADWRRNLLNRLPKPPRDA